MLRSDDSKTGNRGIGVTAKGQKRVSPGSAGGNGMGVRCHYSWA